MRNVNLVFSGPSSVRSPWEFIVKLPSSSHSTFSISLSTPTHFLTVPIYLCLLSLSPKKSGPTDTLLPTFKDFSVLLSLAFSAILLIILFSKKQQKVHFEIDR